MYLRVCVCVRMIDCHPGWSSQADNSFAMQVKDSRLMSPFYPMSFCVSASFQPFSLYLSPFSSRPLLSFPCTIHRDHNIFCRHASKHQLPTDNKLKQSKKALICMRGSAGICQALSFSSNFTSPCHPCVCAATQNIRNGERRRRGGCVCSGPCSCFNIYLLAGKGQWASSVSSCFFNRTLNERSDGRSLTDGFECLSSAVGT